MSMTRLRLAAAPFAIGYSCAYAVVFAYDWPLFIYFPLVGEWYWGGEILPEKGPGMAWYGLMASAAIAGAVFAALLPSRLSERLTNHPWSNYLWVFPLASMLVSVFLLRQLLF